MWSGGSSYCFRRLESDPIKRSITPRVAGPFSSDKEFNTVPLWRSEDGSGRLPIPQVKTGPNENQRRRVDASLEGQLHVHVRCPSTRVEAPLEGVCYPDRVIAHRLIILDPFPHRPAVKGEHEKRVSHHSTRPSLKLERPGLFLECGREDAVSGCVRGTRSWWLSVLSERPGKSALSCDRPGLPSGRSGERLHPDKGPQSRFSSRRKEAR